MSAGSVEQPATPTEQQIMAAIGGVFADSPELGGRITYNGEPLVQAPIQRRDSYPAGTVEPGGKIDSLLGTYSKWHLVVFFNWDVRSLSESEKASLEALLGKLKALLVQEYDFNVEVRLLSTKKVGLRKQLIRV